MPNSGIKQMQPVLGISQVVLVVKNPTASAGDIRDKGSIPGWRLIL